MNQTHLHLLITHLPVFGSILGALVLSYGMWSKSNQTKIASYFLFIVSALGAGIAYLTGEGAEESTEKLQGVSENIIKLHENSAMYSLIGLIILGVLSLYAIFVTYKNTSAAKPVATVSLIIALFSFGLVARTGYLGGQIRHTEISTGALQNTSVNEKGDKDVD